MERHTLASNPSLLPGIEPSINEIKPGLPEIKLAIADALLRLEFYAKGGSRKAMKE